ncbi:MAG: hypothetical protein JWQ71_2036 [Pedosphaera sp.]|nr:hypothetical protein [Pedosphaera sp.]
MARGPGLQQACFQGFLRLLRQSYPGRPIGLVLDRAACHTAPKSQALAESLDILLIWLPKQWSELNGMDQLWRELKAEISADLQFQNIEEHADLAEQWVRSLSKTEALRKAGILSESF